MLAAFNRITINANWVEFLIPITIITVAAYNLIKANTKVTKTPVLFFSTLFFGLIHGLGFAREFNLLIGKIKHKLVPLLEFALGIEISQIIIVFVALSLAYFAQIILGIPKKYWIKILSLILIALTLPMLLNSNLLN